MSFMLFICGLKRLKGLIASFLEIIHMFFIYVKLISATNIAMGSLKAVNQTVCFDHNNLDVSVTKARVYKAH